MASSSSAITCGKASRKKPEMRTVTSIRGRPELGQRHDREPGDPAGGVVPGGRQPISASTSAMSSPWVRMAEVPHTVSPTERG